MGQAGPSRSLPATPTPRPPSTGTCAAVGAGGTSLAGPTGTSTPDVQTGHGKAVITAGLVSEANGPTEAPQDPGGPVESPIPVAEVARIVRQVFGRQLSFRVSRVAPSAWLGGVLVDFDTEDGRVTMHEPGRRLPTFARKDSPPVGEPLDMLSAAGRALRWTGEFLPWAAWVS